MGALRRKTPGEIEEVVAAVFSLVALDIARRVHVLVEGRIAKEWSKERHIVHLKMYIWNTASW